VLQFTMRRTTAMQNSRPDLIGKMGLINSSCSNQIGRSARRLNSADNIAVKEPNAFQRDAAIVLWHPMATISPSAC